MWSGTCAIPLEGIAEVADAAAETASIPPTVFVRTGDTPSAERARFQRLPADILITTPESLYLLLTSQAREALRSVETVIVDEIHALVPTKRGAHLALSLERLERLCGRTLQRIGLSATQRPLEEVARFLGGVENFRGDLRIDKILHAQADAEAAVRYRPVTVLDASIPKPLESERAGAGGGHVQAGQRLGAAGIRRRVNPSGPRSIPSCSKLVRAHESTLIFVNNRRLAERISGALNELAGETLVLAHHGSVAPAQRKEIEERLKSGEIKGLVATSSLELGIDMGAIDLVVQIEAPPSVSSGMQRIGRAGHHVGADSNGIIFPKFRADLLACAAATRAMRERPGGGRALPAQSARCAGAAGGRLVAMEPMTTVELFELFRRAAPFAALSRESFEGVLDLLSGRYPSDEFAELRPRITWDRTTGRLTPRESAQTHCGREWRHDSRSRSLWRLSGRRRKADPAWANWMRRWSLRASPAKPSFWAPRTWRIDEITHDRVLVSPAPGEPGKMPFWHGDGAGRPAEFGQHIGELTRELLRMPAPAASSTWSRITLWNRTRRKTCCAFSSDQQAATIRVPCDEDILIERCRDELGDWRICVLSPYGRRGPRALVHGRGRVPARGAGPGAGDDVGR